MCYPCVNCGKCGSSLPPARVRCPRCKVELTAERPVCPTCGWTLPAPPGATARPDASGPRPGAPEQQRRP